MTQLGRAVAAAASVAVSLGLDVRDSVVLNASTKATVRLMPCDVVARIAPATLGTAALDTAALDTAVAELDVAGQLARAGAPVAPPDPRVPPSAHQRGGFVITFWAPVETTASSAVSVEEYVEALLRLHRALRTVDVVVPHVTDRVRTAQQLLTRVARTPRLAARDRELLQEVLAAGSDRVRRVGGGQVLHGEPHPGNLLPARAGPVFVDWETCCVGPVELDLAHAPAGVGEAYPGVDPDLLRECRLLARAVATTWRYDVDDRLPAGPELGAAWLQQLRATRRGG